MNALFAAGQSGGGADWSKLEDKLKTAGSATNDFLQICQKYWYIPMFFALIIVAGLVLVGGQQGRLQAKKTLSYIFISLAIVFCVPAIVNLFAGLIGKDTTNISTL